MRPNRPARAQGFTLLEVMIVLVIIGVLGGIVTFNLVGAAERAKANSTKISLEVIAKAMDLYKTTYNGFPGTTDLLMSHNMINTSIDSWDRDILVTVPALDFSYEVRSSGADGIWDTPDDIVQYPPNEIQQ